MRLRQRDLKEYTVKKRVPMQDDDGTTYEDYEEIGTVIRASIQPASGKVLSEMYGEKLSKVLILYCDSKVEIKESDGVCVYRNDKPDYKVMVVYPWNHKVAHIERG